MGISIMLWKAEIFSTIHRKQFRRIAKKKNYTNFDVFLWKSFYIKWWKNLFTENILLFHKVFNRGYTNSPSQGYEMPVLCPLAWMGPWREVFSIRFFCSWGTGIRRYVSSLRVVLYHFSPAVFFWVSLKSLTSHKRGWAYLCNNHWSDPLLLNPGIKRAPSMNHLIRKHSQLDSLYNLWG